MSKPRLLNTPVSHLLVAPIRVLPNPQRIPARRNQLPLLIPDPHRARRLPLHARRRVPMVRLDETDEVLVLRVVVVVLDEDALILEADDGEAVAGVFVEGAEGEAEGGARTGVLAWGGRLAPVKSVDWPWKEANA